MLTFKQLKRCKIDDTLLSESRVENEEILNFGDYPGDFILLSGDREIWSKIWSLPDYPGELTALFQLGCPPTPTTDRVPQDHTSDDW